MYSANDDSLTEIEREQVEEQWRREVASRLDRYRGRRKKKTASQASLCFDFEQAEASPAPQSRAAKAVAERVRERFRSLHAEPGAARRSPRGDGPGGNVVNGDNQRQCRSRVRPRF